MNAACKTRQQLIEENQGLVRSLAAKIYCKLPPHVDLEDLIAYGQIGLAEAARDFDPARGSRFSTYAYYRIRGAIYDGLSKMSWFSRARYRQIRYEQMANETLQAQTGEEKTDQPAGPEGNLRWLRGVSRALAVVHLSTHCESGRQERSVPLEDHSAADPTTLAISQETAHRLRAAVDALPQEARELMYATYFEGCTLQEAGKRLGISKSWASRLHARALQRLARSLRVVDATP